VLLLRPLLQTLLVLLLRRRRLLLRLLSLLLPSLQLRHPWVWLRLSALPPLQRVPSCQCCVQRWQHG
jgi:hypothetical protein